MPFMDNEEEGITAAGKVAPGDPLSLSELLERAEACIADEFIESEWVVVQITSINLNLNGHCYMDVVETDRRGGIVAKAKAIIWRGTYGILGNAFLQATGSPLQCGMKVLINCQVQFARLYGLSLIVSDIDPSYTLGEAEAERRSTIARLEAEGLMERNKELALPRLPRCFAVISNVNAAGYGDFMDGIYFELSNKRADERTISYAECHDQAMVGDKTIIFRLCDKEMYTAMRLDSQNLVIDRGIALHKMIRLITLATAGDGYLNFMGNEFGHPEWIDFPRQGNDWSFFYARRQWSLSDSDVLRYKPLKEFDKAMIRLFRDNAILSARPDCLRCDEEKKIIVMTRGDYLFVFSFNPTQSFDNYGIGMPEGEYEIVLDSDAGMFDGFSRNDDAVAHTTMRTTGSLIWQESPQRESQASLWSYTYTPRNSTEAAKT
jgi:Exonuclease VII, large subunit